MKEIMLLDLSSAVKDRRARISRMNRERSNLYGYIYSKISPENEQEVKKHRNFSTFSKEVDPLELWKAVSESHLSSVTTGNATVLRESAFSEYAKIRQGPLESLADFKIKFDMKYKSYID